MRDGKSCVVIVHRRRRAILIKLIEEPFDDYGTSKKLPISKPIQAKSFGLWYLISADDHNETKITKNFEKFILIDGNKRFFKINEAIWIFC